MIDYTFKLLKPIDPRLGRHVEHDPRSTLHKLPMKAAPTKTIIHETFGPWLNQGNIGACVGFSTAHCLNTGPIRTALEKKFPKIAYYGIKEAQNFYHLATALDAWPGVWPPNDTGTSGLAAMKALKKLKIIKSYAWAFGISGVLGAIGSGPLLVGIPWYSSMYNPDTKGMVKASGTIVGGHEVCLKGYEVVGENIMLNLFWFRNSWGKTWGKSGEFCMTVATLDKLLQRDGDAVRPII